MADKLSFNQRQKSQNALNEFEYSYGRRFKALIMVRTKGGNRSSVYKNQDVYILRGQYDDHNMPFVVSAHPIAKAVDLVEEKNPVIVLLGPQVKFLEDKTRKQLAKYNVPVDVIDAAIYGAMNGEEVMKNVYNHLSF